MPALPHFRLRVEQKSGALPVVCSAMELRSHLGFDPAAMRRDGFDPSTLELHEQYYEALEAAAGPGVLGDYLTTLTPRNRYEASGIWVSTLREIRDATLAEGGPEAVLFRHGYLPLAGDDAGNSVVVHIPSGRVLFAHHERIEELLAGEHDEVAQTLEGFLDDLLTDRLTESLASRA